MRRLLPRATTERSRAGRRLVAAVGVSTAAVLVTVVVPSGALAGLAGGARQGRRVQGDLHHRGEEQAGRGAGVGHGLPARRDPPAPQRAGRREPAAQPQRPEDEELRLPERHGHRRRHGRPDHAEAGPRRRRLGRGPAQRRPSPSSRRVPVTTATHTAVADQPLQHVQRLLRPAVHAHRTSGSPARRRPPSPRARSVRPPRSTSSPAPSAATCSTPRRRPSSTAPPPTVAYAAQPGATSDWVVTMPKAGQFKFQPARQGLPHRHAPRSPP